MEKYRYLSLLFMFLLMSCQSAKVSQDTSGPTSRLSSPVPSDENTNIAYPDWFWQPPLNLSFSTAVGYGLTGRYPEEALKRAIDDGIESVAKSIRVRIHGKQISTDRQLIPGFQEETDASVKEHVKEKYQVLATNQDKALTMVLLGLGTTPNVPDHITTASPSPPSWLEKLPDQPGYIYALGQSYLGAYPGKAWVRAEGRARINLALTCKSNISTLKRLVKKVIEVNTRQVVDVTLTGTETVERWYDAREQVCHVLVRVQLPQNK